MNRSRDGHGRDDDDGEATDRREAVARHYHVDRWAQLPEETREWIEAMRPRDIRDYEEAVNFHKRMKTNGRFVMYVGGTIIGVFFGFATFADHIVKVFSWWRGIK